MDEARGTVAQRLVEARLLNTRVHAVTIPVLLALIEAAMAERRPLTIGHQNLHSLALLQDDAVLRAFYESCDVVYADGLPVVAAARLLGYPFTRAHRLTSLDFIAPLLAEAATAGRRVFYLGSAPGVIDRAVATWRSRHPGLHLEFAHGHFDMGDGSQEAEAVARQIVQARPDLLIVGMGMPRQEHWLRAYREQLPATVVLPIGALADYVADAIPTPPRWAGQLGMEWLFRLAAEPRRLGYRYLIEPWRLVVPFARDLAAHLRRRGRN